MDKTPYEKALLPDLEVELRSRIRLALACTLSARGFWPTTSAYRKYMRAQARRGQQIGAALLKEGLGEVDFRYLDIGKAFTANLQSQPGLPGVAAFGFDLSRTMHRLLGGAREDAKPGAKLCSLFNMGISLFDHIIDAEPEMLPELAGFIDENTVAELVNDGSAPERLLKRCSTERAIEIRTLCKIIGSFFRDLHALQSKSGRPEVSTEINEYILSSYRAEMASVNAAHLPEAQQLELGNKTFSLPFLTMSSITRLSPSATLENAKDFQTAVTGLGELFRLLDDLNDVLDDWEAGRANAIVGHVRTRGAVSSEDRAKFLAELLARDRIEATAESLCEKVAGVLDLFASVSVAKEEQSLIRNFVAMHVRGWVR